MWKKLKNYLTGHVERLKDALRIFWRLITGKHLTVLDFQIVLSSFPDQPVAKVVHQTRKFTALQFIVKMPRPKNKKTRKGVAW